jgi:dipeptidyl aminopeptidase/acylaminoacyl peptidase
VEAAPVVGTVRLVVDSNATAISQFYDKGEAGTLDFLRMNADGPSLGGSNYQATFEYALIYQDVTALGGEIETAVEVLEGEVDFHDLDALLPDGRGFLTVVHKEEAQDFGNVTWVDGSERRELVQMPGAFVFNPRYAPPGHIVFLVQRAQGRSGLWAVPFDIDQLEVAGEPFLVVRDAGTPSVVGDTLVYAPALTAFVNELVWVDRSGQVLEVIGEPRQGLYPAVELSPDGERALFGVADRQGKALWAMDLDSGQANRVAFEPEAIVQFAAWEPSGEHVAYGITTGGDDLRLMVKSPDSSTDAELLTEGTMDLDFSPDGRSLVFVRPRPGFMNDLWVRDLETGEESIFVQTDTWDILPAFSPDGRYVAYQSQGEAFVTRFPEAEPRWQVSGNGGAAPQWSADGRQLYFFQGDRFFEVDVDSGPQFRAANPVELFTFAQAPGDWDFVRSFAVDGKGERFLMVRVSGTPPGIVVFQNWLEGLARQ